MGVGDYMTIVSVGLFNTNLASVESLMFWSLSINNADIDVENKIRTTTMVDVSSLGVHLIYLLEWLTWLCLDPLSWITICHAGILYVYAIAGGTTSAIVDGNNHL